MHPHPPSDELPLVLHDLSQERTVAVGRGGVIRHWEECPVGTDHGELLTGLKLPAVSYVAEFEYPLAKERAGGPVHPRVRILDSEISVRTMPEHPHFNRTKDNLDSWACPIPPHDTDWAWCKGATADYLDHVAIWILKTVVWRQTGGGLLTSAIWVGPYSRHDPAGVLALAERGPCHCGSGVEYAGCHRSEDLRKSGRSVVS